jgi:hypothetical protein
MSWIFPAVHMKFKGYHNTNEPRHDKTNIRLVKYNVYLTVIYKYLIEKYKINNNVYLLCRNMADNVVCHLETMDC